MPGKGPAPKPAAQRRRRNQPVRGEWSPAPGLGWQFKPMPDPPHGLLDSSTAAWMIWLGSWFAAHWTPDDLPGLYQVIQLFDQCQRYFADPYIEKETAKGDTIFVLRPNPSTELRQMMDNYGITPKGQQDRRWTRPKPVEPADSKPAARRPRSPYAHLKVVPA